MTADVIPALQSVYKQVYDVMLASIRGRVDPSSLSLTDPWQLLQVNYLV
jgi:hypothetical protein